MSRLNSLSPDLSAALSLLLRQRKRYAEVAALLGIQERAVHDRAHAALALLAPAQARALSAEQRERVGEYLLGQQTADEQRDTKAMLARDPAARAWAQSLTAELEPLATQLLPPIPIPSAPEREPRHGSSRAGGAIVLGAIAAAIIVAVLLIVGVGGGGKTPAASNPSASSTGASGSSGTRTATTSNSGGSTTGTSASSGTSATNGESTPSTASASNGTSPSSGAPNTTRSKALPLTPPDPASSKALGVAYVFTQKGRRAFYLLTKGLPTPPSGAFYAVWLQDGPSGAPDYPLGSLPAATAEGVIEGGGPLPNSAGSYRRIAVTTETSHRPSSPGPTALRGPFSLH
jgi:hypothetical protein